MCKTWMDVMFMWLVSEITAQVSIKFGFKNLRKNCPLNL
jgi:hypothetical protein